MVKNNLGKEAKAKKSVPTPKKKFMFQISKQARTVQSVPLPKNKIILKKKKSLDHSKSQRKQTTPNKKKSSEQPATENTPRRSPTEREKTPRRSSPRFKNRSEEHDYTAEKSTPIRSSPRKRKSCVEPESAAQSEPVQSTSGSSQIARSKEVIEKQKTVKHKFYQSGPCPNVKIRNPNDTFSDMVEEDEEYEDEEEVELENDVATEERECEDKEMENDREKDIAANKNEKGDEVVQGEEKRKRVPHGPTRMASLGLIEDKTKKPDKATVSFNNKDHPIGDTHVQLASVLGVLVRRNIPLTFKDWRVVPKEAKANVWKIVQMRFIVDDFYRDYYYGKMGCYLKEVRSRKAGKILALDEL
ncbi:hypothetical protein MKW98_019227 [Papaver atlanticum]|uniref:Uncharacterized protein n=1 Tax=Papaver atlanticum TaxID=357466 RepID=A0AAD4XRW0_9MAGN|nr:hypothetical protein MKW98_019227 [Papaver atlanticum]